MNFKYIFILISLSLPTNPLIGSWLDEGLDMQDYVLLHNTESAEIISDDQSKQNPLVEQWFSAIKFNKQDLVRQLIPKIDVNIKNEEGSPALMCAISDGNEDLVRLLLQVPEIDINVIDDYGETPLSYASYMGLENIVITLLQNPTIDINAQNESGDSALLEAVKFKHENVVKILIKVPGIDINAQNNNGWTALTYAAFTGEKNITMLLLECPKININAQTGAKTAAQWALYRLHSTLSKIIEDKVAQLAEQGFNAISAWGKAKTEDERQKNLEILKSIVHQIGIDSITDKDNNTFLDKAFSLHSTEIIFFLLENAKSPQYLLSRFPFEVINPTSELFKLCMKMAYASAETDAGNKSGDAAPIAPKQIIRLCAQCGTKPCNKKCSRCKNAFYCSVECQKKDWMIHKSHCASPAS